MRIRKNLCGGVIKRAEVNIDATESTAHLYRDTEGKIYTDVTLETPLTSTVDSETVQVEALDTNTLTTGTTVYTKFTAGDLDVEDSNKYQLLLESEQVYYVEDGVPSSSNIQCTDVTTDNTSTTEISENPDMEVGG